MDDPTMPWSATIAFVDTEDPPPNPPVWRPREPLVGYERALLRWVREMLAWARRHHHRHPAVAIRLRIEGERDMSQVSISVDAQNEKAVANWTDDHGDVTEAPNGPDGAPASIQYASSDPSVIEVAPDGSLTLVKAGDASVTATAVDDTGGVLANFQTASVDVTVTPGPAQSLVVSVQP